MKQRSIKLSILGYKISKSFKIFFNDELLTNKNKKAYVESVNPTLVNLKSLNVNETVEVYLNKYAFSSNLNEKIEKLIDNNKQYKKYKCENFLKLKVKDLPPDEGILFLLFIATLNESKIAFIDDEKINISKEIIDQFSSDIKVYYLSELKTQLSCSKTINLQLENVDLHSKDEAYFNNNFFDSLHYIKHNKTKLFLPLILASIVFSFFNVITTFSSHNQTKVLLKKLEKDNINETIIEKEINYYSHNSYFLQQKEGFFDDEEVSKIKEYTTNKCAPIYSTSLYFGGDNNEYAIKRYFTQSYKIIINNIDVLNSFSLSFYNGLKEDTLNRVPTNDNEIMISDIYAHYLLRFGVKTYVSEGKSTLVKLNSIDELIGMKILDNYKIVGIASKNNALESTKPYFNKKINQISDYEYYLLNGFEISKCIFLFSNDYESIKPNKYIVELKNSFTSNYKFIKSLCHDNVNVLLINKYSVFDSIPRNPFTQSGVMINSIILSFSVPFAIALFIYMKIYIKKGEYIVYARLGIKQFKNNKNLFYSTLLLAGLAYMVSLIISLIVLLLLQNFALSYLFEINIITILIQTIISILLTLFSYLIIKKQIQKNI